MKKDYFPQLVSEICQEHSIGLKILHDGRIRILSLNGIERIIWSKKFELNSVISARIADNKSSTYEVLNKNDIPCVYHKRYVCHYKNKNFYLDEDSIQNLLLDIEKYHEIVLKPENGYEGIDVYRCSCLNDISQIFNYFQKPYSHICSSPYYSVIAEYRTICLHGKALLTYQKKLPFVTGNGYNTVQELALQKYETNLGDIITQMPETFYKQVPTLGEHVNIGWKFNLSQGAQVNAVINSDTLKVIQDLSIKAANAIHINFSSVDIIETFSGDLLIMEINSGVVLNKFIEDNPHNYDIAKNIYTKAILSMFNEKTYNYKLSFID